MRAGCHRVGPRGRCDQQGGAFGATQDAGKAAQFRCDGLPHLTTFAYPYATPPRHIREPDRTFGVYADAVRCGAVQIGPHSTPGETAVCGNVVRGKRSAIGLGHDQRRVVGCHGHAIGKSQALGNELS